jgi:hypothetical protein
MAVFPPQKVCRAALAAGALAVAALAAVAGAAGRPPAPAPVGSPSPRLAAGFRFSAYGPDYNPGPAYWKRVGERMAERFPGSVPGAVWIVGRLKGQGCELSFPGRSTDPLIQFASEDGNEKALDLFDAAGFEVWLQVEPGHAPVATLIDLVLARYRHHPSVVGFGIDVEWYRSVDEPEGQAVTDAEARAWLAAARAHKPGYRLFLKHWLTRKMPPTAREGLTFIDDSQILPSLDAMVDEFAEWAKTFAPAPVGFQIGYDSDRPWWEKLRDPPTTIGRRILEAAPNTAGLYWVDFSVLDVFPPEAPAAGSSARAPTPPRIGVKIYEHDGDLDALFGTWRELGIDTAFASEALAGAPGFRAKAAGRAVRLFLIAPVFYNPQALAEDPTLFAITAEGTPARQEWVEFVCPSRPAYRARRVREIAEAVRRIRPDGLSLDFLRHFVFWEKVPVGAAADSFPNTCFCDRCVASFAARAGLTIPRDALGNPRAAAGWILAGHEAAWTEWKVELIDSMAAETIAAAREAKPDLEIVLHAVPWRRHDYGGAVLRIAGQDHERLARRFDYLSPMAYAHMLRRPPRWIRSVVRTLAATTGARILPSIQVQEAYRPGEPLTAEEFAQDLREALRPPSAGVVLWSWDGLAKEPEKQRALRSVLAEGATRFETSPRPR